MIPIQCPKCQRRYNVADSLAGKTARCMCRQVFPIPAATASARHDVFISYSSTDSSIALVVCSNLESAGIRCWIAPRSITPGKDYGEAIIEGINDCQVFVLVLSQTANTSKQVKFEIERAASKGKRLLPFRIHSIPLAPALEYFLSSSHWLDATTAPLQKHLPLLIKAVKELLPASGSGPSSVTPSVNRPVQENEKWRQALAHGELTVELSAVEAERIGQLASVLSEDMQTKGFPESDAKKTSVVLKELINNVKVHVPDPQKWVRVQVNFLGSTIRLMIEDKGPGFDLGQALERLWDKLRNGDREHGLLRAIRYGTSLEQGSSDFHVVTWTRSKRPTTLSCQFEGTARFIPVVFDYEGSLIRIAQDVYLNSEFFGQDRCDPAFRALLFEPIRRSSAPFVGLEIRGMHHTLDLDEGRADGFLASLWKFLKTEKLTKKLVVLLDTEREDHQQVWKFYAQNGRSQGRDEADEMAEELRNMRMNEEADQLRDAIRDNNEEVLRKWGAYEAVQKRAASPTPPEGPFLIFEDRDECSRFIKQQAL